MKPRYAQEDHTHADLEGGATAGALSIITATPGSSALTAFACSSAVSGTAAAQTIDPTSAAPLQTRSRTRYTSTTGVAYVAHNGTTTSAHSFNTTRGFSIRTQFGLGSFSATDGRLFVGLTAASNYAMASDWSAYGATGFGLCVDAASGFRWCQATGAAGTGTTVDSGMAVANDALYVLELESDGGVTTGTLTSVDSGASATRTFTSVPTGGLRMVHLFRQGVGTGYFYFVRLDTYEDLLSPFSA